MDRHWTQVTPSEFPWERDALAFLKQPSPYRAGSLRRNAQAALACRATSSRVPVSGWPPRRAMAASPVFRADEDAAQAVSHHLDVLADALQALGGEGRDEVDDRFLGVR